ncbi:MerR family transcriptional regulator [Pseudarthrobacter phenanthrenivorans]|uniref:MerR family transcriptional regulator n=1 Tax=Pseudarthrobacter phenanthrenivorans TaxID=361575 RepID=UPI00112B1934|nr:MerR family transcriptional regulator [Pseudarthrobacter phenanthrenivorans]TPV50241.1 MerR family transcriptional regulator [Pseudarthrobacter phenanthrenivorans]
MQATEGKAGPEWSIQDVARIAGTTSRTLRHYDDIGLLKPSRVGNNGYRYYDGAALLQLQRILLLRELGLGLPAIAEVFRQQGDAVRALSSHLEWLGREQERLSRQMASVRQTIEKVKGGSDMVAEEMFDGFDHTQYKDEVEERWGRDAYAKSDAWWRGMGVAEKRDWKARAEQLGSSWLAAAAGGIPADGPEAEDLAGQHVAWLASIPGTPASERGGDLKGYVIGLAEMYVADARFAANYGGEAGAGFVRDALRAYAEKHL